MIGVLALQGNYQMHFNMLSSIGVESVFVKTEADLLKCKGLIIPGGESTVISKLMIKYNLFNPINSFAKKNSIFGTCAGLILMANKNSENIKSLNIMDVEVRRNAWGRQINSFTKDIVLDFNKTNSFKATFIRAPKIKSTSSSISVLARIDKEPVMIRQGCHLATTFHPEMHKDPLIHKYFLQIVDKNE